MCLSATALGKWTTIALARLPVRQFILSTKVGRYGEADFDFSAARVTASVEESMSRLHVQYVDIILWCAPPPEAPVGSPPRRCRALAGGRGWGSSAAARQGHPARGRASAPALSHDVEFGDLDQIVAETLPGARTHSQPRAPPKGSRPAGRRRQDPLCTRQPSAACAARPHAARGPQPDSPPAPTRSAGRAQESGQGARQLRPKAAAP